MFHHVFGLFAGNAVLGDVPDVVVIPLKDHEYQYIPKLRRQSSARSSIRRQNAEDYLP
jgi:hypothetical protein